MKYNGKTVEPSFEYVVFPRKDGDIVFRLGTVTGFDEFENICPEPQPPFITKPGGEKFRDYKDADYNKKYNQWLERRSQYMILKSISYTEGLEWETVDMNEPSTWGNYTKELAAAGFSDIAQGRIIDAAMTACGLNQRKIDEATKSFLLTQGLPLDGVSSQDSEQNDTLSGDVVND